MLLLKAVDIIVNNKTYQQGISIQSNLVQGVTLLVSYGNNFG